MGVPHFDAAEAKVGVRTGFDGDLFGETEGDSAGVTGEGLDGGFSPTFFARVVEPENSTKSYAALQDPEDEESFDPCCHWEVSNLAMDPRADDSDKS